ncbi:MAG TPA: hypothetical protein PK911_05245 [Candidatus Saccharibacteria bacterium]|nr:hypothetical protein [Candidatus Saccharibacteria bacterium]
MPLSVVYINVDGQPMSEIRGGVVTEYVHDPLGNLIATNTSVGIVTWTGDYWPYGESMISSGTKANNWGFCAAWGYYDDGYDNSYVRRRVLRRRLAKWQTVDPLWPSQRPYAYSKCRPTHMIDPTGLQPQVGKGRYCWERLKNDLNYVDALKCLAEAKKEGKSGYWALAKCLAKIPGGKSYFCCTLFADKERQPNGDTYYVDPCSYQDSSGDPHVNCCHIAYCECVMDMLSSGKFSTAEKITYRCFPSQLIKKCIDEAQGKCKSMTYIGPFETKPHLISDDIIKD